MAAVEGMSINAAVAAVSSDLDNFTLLKEEQNSNLKTFLGVKCFCGKSLIYQLAQLIHEVCCVVYFSVVVHTVLVRCFVSLIGP